MQFTFSPATLTGFSLVLVRATAFVVLCPPFNTPTIPIRIRLGFATALALVLAHVVGPHVATLTTAQFVTAMGVQLLAGLALAAFVFVLFQAIQGAGELMDLQVGFGMGAQIDPFSGNQANPLGRFHQLLGMGILFAVNGHVIVVRAFVDSVVAAPMGHVSLSALAGGLTHLVTVLVMAAIEIALPILAALFCTEVALGLLGKAAPQLNILVIGFGLKAFIALALLGATLGLLPESAQSLIGQAIRGATKVFGG